MPMRGIQEDIDAEAAQDPAVVATKSEFDAVEGWITPLH